MANIIVCNGARHMGIKSTVKYISRLFTSGEVDIQIPNGKIDSKEVFIVQSFQLPNTHLMELMITIDACRRSGAKKIHAILPYFPYSRQDQRHDTGTPISARVVADMLASVNPDSIVSFDLHAPQIQGFFNNKIQFKHVQMGAFFTHNMLNYFENFGDQSWVFVSPDSGALKRTKKFALLSNNKNLCNIIKYREKAQEIESMRLIGDIEGKNAVLFDDMIDTGGTLNNAIKLLYDNGANMVVSLATHPVYSDPEKVKTNLDNHRIFTTDSIDSKTNPSNAVKFPLYNLIYDIISRIESGLRLGELNSNVNIFY
jgi:ribose-phosphate pyrophosphokinase